MTTKHSSHYKGTMYFWSLPGLLQKEVEVNLCYQSVNLFYEEPNNKYFTLRRWHVVSVKLLLLLLWLLLLLLLLLLYAFETPWQF